MKIIETYSHLNGLEFLLVHKPRLWEETKKVITAVDAKACKTKVAREKTRKGKLLYSPVAMNSAFKRLLSQRKWAGFIKDRVAIEVQFGKYSFVAYDLFVKHLAFYIGDHIDVGIEILPMKSL